MFAKTPFRYDPVEAAVYGTSREYEGAEVKVCSLNGWRYLTGRGLGHLGLPLEDAKRRQDEAGELIAVALNGYHGCPSEKLTARED